MSKQQKMDFNLSARNIGPLREFSSSQKVGSCKIGIFANNGSGKTFLSRRFRLVGVKEHAPEQLNNLLTINEKNGRFIFEIKNPDENGRVRALSINLTRNAEQPVVSNETGFLFHVFNSDYVRANIEEREYAPDGNVEGYILGKGNIDLSKEKNELRTLVDKQGEVVSALKSDIESARGNLVLLGVRKNLGEYKEFSYENFINGLDVDESLSFSRLTDLHNDLKAMPDDLPDVRLLPSAQSAPNLAEIKELLQTEYSRSNIAEDFVAKVKSKQSFIEEGLRIDGMATCPFCEQPYSVQATELIQRYNDYLNDEEAAVAKCCENKISELRFNNKHTENSIIDVLRSSRDFDQKKKFIPSMKDEGFSDFPSIEMLSNPIEILCQLLADKARHIDKVDFDISDSQREIELFFTLFERIRGENLKKIELFNSKKNNVQNEKRELDRRLCRALFLETSATLSPKVGEVSSRETEIEKLRLDIEKREAQVRVEKKKRVAESLVLFLDLFFAGKYCFDKKQFHITFEGQVLDQKITSVLSDGEKSIVAFCHYLAETHVHLTREEDYKKIFFIIDDPISSLDFHYVYAVAQVIRNIGVYFNLQGYTRFMVLTHNIEFMSILSRNKIVQQRFVLSAGKLDALNEHLIMPYESHLRDIHAVAREGTKPKHTTSNSIRHVLETISRFDAPRAKLEDYFGKIEELQGNEFVYSLMHDASHGMIRSDKAYTDDMIQRGCEAVVRFIENKFEGQIDHVARS